LKGDKECEEHHCEALRYCSWHPNECFGKPWAKSCKNCKYAVRRKDYDIEGFEGYYCQKYQEIVHDYYAACEMWVEAER
jgi:predicted metal-dependent phosphoesterase TrpH